MGQSPCMQGTEAKTARAADCCDCGTQIVCPGSRGRLRKRCDVCQKAINRVRGRQHYEFVCQSCGGTDVGAYRRKFCRACNDRLFSAATAECQNCGIEYKRWAAGGKTYGKFCSQKCCWDSKRAARTFQQLIQHVQRSINQHAKDLERAERALNRDLARWFYEWDQPLRTRRNKKSNRPKGSRKHCSRARKKGLPRTGGITIEAVGRLDGWVCNLCGGPISDIASRSAPDAPCVDHIVPLNHKDNLMHGHTWRNVQIAHRKCNEAKGAKLCCSSLLGCDNPRQHIKQAGICQLVCDPPQVGKSRKVTRDSEPHASPKRIPVGLPPAGCSTGGELSL
jgi:hypothetical protein